MDSVHDGGSGRDLSTLAWVHDELRRSLELAHKALRRHQKEAEAASEVDAVDPALLRQARTLIHQGAGALDLVGLGDAAVLLRAAEAAVVRCQAKPKLLDAAALETIERGSFALLDLLGRRLAGREVPALMLFPQYRALQQLAGATRVHPADLWPFEWQWRELPVQPGDEALPGGARTLARAERDLLDLMRGHDADAPRRLERLFAGLGASPGESPAQRRLAQLWRLAAAFFEAQADGLLQADVQTKRLASRLLSLLKAGERAEATERLALDLLFFCGQAQSAPVAPPSPSAPGVQSRQAGPRLAEVRRQHGLPSAPAIEYEAARLGRFDPALLAQARKRVAGAKEVWSAVAGGELVRMPGLAEQFALVGDSMQRLYPQGERLARAVQAAASQTVASGAEPPANLAMEVATSLLYVDASLEDGDLDHPELATRVNRLAERIDAARAGAEAAPLERWMEELYRRVSDRQTMGSVVQELRASLSEVEKQIDQFFRDPTNSALLIPVPAQLSAMRGVLSVLGMDQASQAVLRMRDDVDALAGTEVDPLRAQQTGTFDRLADNLGALSFLIDMVSVQPAMAKSLFQFDPATGSLRAVMGRAVRAVAEPAPAVPAVPEPHEQLAQDIAKTAARPDADAAALARDLGALALQAAAADRPELAGAAEAARQGLQRADGEAAVASARERVVEQLASQLPGPTPQPAPAPVPATMDLAADDEMRGIFLEEVHEVVAGARESLAALEHDSASVAEITVVRRAFHTLKGSSRMVGLRDFGEAAWCCEQLFNARLAEGAPADPDLRGLAGDALSAFERWAHAIERGEPPGADAAAIGAAADALRLERRRVPIAAAAAAAGAASMADAASQVPLAVSVEGLDILGSLVADDPRQAGAAVAPAAALPAEATSLAQADLALPSLEVPLVLDLSEPPDAEPTSAPTLADMSVADLQRMVPSLPRADELDFTLDFGAAGQEPVLDLAEDPLALRPTAPLPGAALEWPPVAASATAAPATPAVAADPLVEATTPEVSFELDLGTLESETRSAPALEPAQPLQPASLEVTTPEIALVASALESVQAAQADEPAVERMVEPSEPAEIEAAPDALPAVDVVEVADALAPAESQAMLGSAQPGGLPAPPADSTMPDVTVEELADEVDLAEFDLLPPPSLGGAPLGLAAARPVEPALADAADEPSTEAAALAAADAEQYKVIGPLRIGIALFNIYLNEADELSRRLVGELGEWSHLLDRPMGDTPIALAHSLAGSSATVGYADLSQLARALEHALMRAQNRGSAEAGEAALFNEAAEQVRYLLHQFAAGFLKPVPAELVQRLHEHDAPRQMAAEASTSHPDAPADDAGRRTGDESAVAVDLPIEAEPVDAANLAVIGDRQDAPAQQRSEGAAPTEDDEPYETRPAELDAPREAAPWERPAPVPVPEELVDAAAPTSANAPDSALAPALAAAAAAAALPAALVDLGQPALRDFDSRAPMIAAAVPLDARDDDEDIDAVDEPDNELFPIFEEEAEELLPQLQSRMREWSSRPGDAAAAAACMRTLHTLKGGARLAGAMRLGELAHRLETALEHLQAQADVQPAQVDALMLRVDSIEARFEALRRQPAALALPDTDVSVDESALKAADPVVVAAAEPASETVEEAAPGPEADVAAAAVAESGAPAPGTAAATAAAPAAPARIDWSRFTLDAVEATGADPAAAGAGAVVRVRSGLLDRVVNHSGEISITRSRIEADVGQLRGAVGDLSDNLERLRSQLRDIELQAETQIASRLEAAKQAAQFDPLEMDRFTRFQELTRMMAEAVNDVATVQRGLQRTLQSTEDELAAQARLTRDLQDDLLRTRMVEFEGLSERLYRVVRQAAKEAGRQVRLDIVGGSIEVDRGVLERMTGSFEHLLRNAVAHGIEPPDLRVAAGKDATGTIVVAVVQEGNEVAIEFRDDGAGLDLARIRQRGEALGLLAPGSVPTDAELAALIFQSGFSTAETVTGLAGRGVGMDVVRSEVAAMGGRIETATAAGRGASFRLVLPLTTAVTQVVMLRCGEMTVAVPSTLVEIVRRAPPAEVASAYAEGTYTYQDRTLPFFWLASLLQGTPLGHVTGRTAPVVVIRSAAQRVAVHVDEVVGNQEVVVKNLGPQLVRLPGLTGMTLLPSGLAALIYNPVALATVYGEAARRATVAARATWTTAAQAATSSGTVSPAMPSPASAAMPQQAPLVVVVDDSLTVRRVTQRLLAREGYRVVTAKDGMEGLEKLGIERPAVLLTDIEMPRMDGFDLVRNLRVDAKLAGLPVIMITSRIAQRHRDYAAELGVDHYLGKPYSEEELLALVARYARAAAPRDSVTAA